MPLITDNQRLNEVCQSLAGHAFLTLDTEFLREKTYYPKLCLIQIGTPEGQAWAVDPLDGDMDLQPLFDLLVNPGILKVLHAARQDLEIFYQLMGKVVHPFFDTQIAAMVCGYGDSVGYEALVRNIAGAQIDKSVQFTDWSNRPLSKRQIDYALGDVTHLVKIYRHLSAKLEERGRTSWVFEEEAILEDPRTYQNTPEDAWQRIKIKSPRPKMLAILREVAAWRERRAQEKNLPRNWIMRDETLADLAAQAPKNAEELKKIRNIPGDMAEKPSGKALLECIQKGLAVPKNEMPEPEKKKPLSPQAAATADILRMLLKVKSAEHEVAARLVASKDDIEAIAVDDNADVPALRGWRREVFGEDALALKHGKLAIGLKGSSITKFKVTGDTGLHE
ncbi:MAG TPA: ribonuclease D [Rhodospirillaceae bacterium]|nr:ribonuclease D [Rhodospirillaceae bacterium]